MPLALDEFIPLRLRQVAHILSCGLEQRSLDLLGFDAARSDIFFDVLMVLGAEEPLVLRLNGLALEKRVRTGHGSGRLGQGGLEWRLLDKLLSLFRRHIHGAVVQLSYLGLLR